MKIRQINKILNPDAKNNDIWTCSYIWFCFISFHFITTTTFIFHLIWFDLILLVRIKSIVSILFHVNLFYWNIVLQYIQLNHSNCLDNIYFYQIHFYICHIQLGKRKKQKCFSPQKSKNMKNMKLKIWDKKMKKMRWRNEESEMKNRRKWKIWGDEDDWNLKKQRLPLFKWTREWVRVNDMNMRFY